MGKLTLRLPDDLHAAVQRRADNERRSLNTMTLLLIERGMLAPDPTPDTPESVAEKARLARTVMDSAERHFKPHPKPSAREKKR